MTMRNRIDLAKLLKEPTRRKALTGLAITIGGMSLRSTKAGAATEDKISHTAEAIHHEPIFTASRQRIYEILIETKQFDKVVDLSGARKSMPSGGKPTEISREAGGAFTIFGGHIIGRQIELLPNERIVQAWRVVDWGPGIYSIARFELVERDSRTTIVFDHTGFPKGLGEHLAAGWREHYWEPLKKLLG